MKQTAVEWLADFFETGVPSCEEWTQAKKQAKAKERSQKAEEYLKGFKDGKEYQIKLDELTFKTEIK